jgi:hypothetical protein
VATIIEKILASHTGDDVHPERWAVPGNLAAGTEIATKE